jgi:RNA polymerase sigma factor (sigma-70 family)
VTPQYLLKPARLAGPRLLQTQSDERLLDLVRSGSESAFETIVSRYRPQLVRYCSRLLPADRAEDAVQQAFANAYGAIRRSDGDVQLRPWLYRITHNAALRILRDRKLRYEELDEDHDGVDTPVQAFDRRERLREVVAAIQTLPERQREAILLREIEGRSYVEIAAELGVNPGAVRQLLNRARNALRAAATALIPPGFLVRLYGSSPRAGRAAEVGAELGLGSAAVKASATLLVAGAAVTGVAGGPIPGLGGDDDGERQGRAQDAVADQLAPRSGGATHLPTASLSAGDGKAGRAHGAAHSGDGGDSGSSGAESGDYSSGSGSGSAGYPSGSGSGSSGSGSGAYADNSGPGSYSSGSGSGSSGSGSGAYADNSGPGSYSSGSGSGSSGSGSGALPDNSGPGSYSSGSGSGSSGSGSNGSGSGGSDSSGSGSSGSGSGGYTSDNSG